MDFSTRLFKQGCTLPLCAGQLSCSDTEEGGNPKLWVALSGGRVVVFDAASWSMLQDCIQVGNAQLVRSPLGWCNAEAAFLTRITAAESFKKTRWWHLVLQTCTCWLWFCLVKVLWKMVKKLCSFTEYIQYVCIINHWHYIILYEIALPYMTHHTWHPVHWPTRRIMTTFIWIALKCIPPCLYFLFTVLRVELHVGSWPGPGVDWLSWLCDLHHRPTQHVL